MRRVHDIGSQPLREDAKRPAPHAMLRITRNPYWSIAMVAWETWLNVVIDFAFAE